MRARTCGSVAISNTKYISPSAESGDQRVGTNSSTYF